MRPVLKLAKLAGLAALGLMGVNVTATLGGAEAGPVAFALAVMEIARACASTAVACSAAIVMPSLRIAS